MAALKPQAAFPADLSTPRIGKNVGKWKAIYDKPVTVKNVESAANFVENSVETVNTRSISACFPQSDHRKPKKHRRYAVLFQRRFQHLLKRRKTKHMLPAIIL
ncbi:MAG: hypothetical protein IK130_10735 [Oscillospiraceae bacterium]|nr:hypothetical protein [Oscillospiraceae bacterium]